MIRFWISGQFMRTLGIVEAFNMAVYKFDFNRYEKYWMRYDKYYDRYFIMQW